MSTWLEILPALMYNSNMLSRSTKSYGVVWLEVPQRQFFFFFDLRTFKACLPYSIVDKRLLALSILESLFGIRSTKKIIKTNKNVECRFK